MRPQQRDKCIATMRVSDYHAGQVIIEEGSIGTTMVSLLLCTALLRAYHLPFDAGTKCCCFLMRYLYSWLVLTVLPGPWLRFC